jgi:hypothetical protein
LAPDTTRLAELEQAVRQWMAWKTIEAERETLDLSAFESNQAKTKREGSEESIRQRIPETYHWLLVPEQPDPHGALGWQEVRVQGADGPAVRASKRLRTEDLLVSHLAGHPLRRELDKIPLWPDGVDHLSIRQLIDYHAQYPYLTRVRDGRVLAEAIQDGVGLVTWQQDSFAYADDWDDVAKRYQGLRTGQLIAVNADGRGLIVKPGVALKQLEAEQAAKVAAAPTYPAVPDGNGSARVHEGTGQTVPTHPAVKKSRRFHGSVQLDPTKMGREASTINVEVIQHLVSLMGANAKITLEIEVNVADGVPDNVIRTVMENCRTLKFSSQEFEAE